MTHCMTWLQYLGEGMPWQIHLGGCRDLRVMAMRSDRQSPALQEARQAMVQWWLLPAALSLLQEVRSFQIHASAPLAASITA